MTRRGLGKVPIAIFGLLLTFALRAQALPAAKPAFDVASVKPNVEDGGAPVVRFSRGNVTYSGITLRVLIRTAYRVQNSQITGGPGWLDSSRFDIAAKAGGNPGPLEMLSMLQTLLEDRFRLVVHRETRVLPLYSLVMANSGRPLGPGFRQATEAECATPVTAAPPCGGVRNSFGVQSGFSATSIPMSQFALAFSNVLHTWVEDKTGLEGKFDFRLTWAPDGDVSPGPGSPENSGPSIFTAMQEQLGLKLLAGKGPVEMLVIDSADKPSQN